MREFINIVEGTGNDFIAHVKQNKPEGTTVELSPMEGSKAIFVAYLEGMGTGLVPFICQAADQFKVPLILLVDVYSEDDGGKLVRYYERHGFDITGCATGEALNAAGELELGKGFEHDEIHMRRLPR